MGKNNYGVYTACKKNGELYYRASLTFKNKHISLGSFSTAQAAHKAYLEGNNIISDSSITLIDHTADSALSFEKWVCLINFRDNNIYMSNPIYVGQRLFYYYLSPTHVLKFDMDDLFYFSSHKIMCRGHHYFVADYGMQVSITQRYGIMSYAVEGRDYVFLNGDDTDFRRENLDIINCYRGVRQTVRCGRKVYSVYIHIKGDVLVGRYDDELHAAIAYNKAVDILKKNGINRSYSPNYIEGLSPSKYAEIYSNVEISKGVYEYRA